MTRYIIVMQDFNINILSVQLYLSLTIITVKQIFIKQIVIESLL